LVASLPRKIHSHTLSPKNCQDFSRLSSTHDGAAEELAIDDSIGGVKTGSGGLATELLLGEATELLGESLLESSHLLVASEASHGLGGHDGGGLHVRGLGLHNSTESSELLGESLLESSGLDDGAAVEATVDHTVSGIEGSCVALGGEASSEASKLLGESSDNLLGESLLESSKLLLGESSELLLGEATELGTSCLNDGAAVEATVHHAIGGVEAGGGGLLEGHYVGRKGGRKRANEERG